MGKGRGYRHFFQLEPDRLEALSIATFAVGCARRGRAKRPAGGTRYRAGGSAEEEWRRRRRVVGCSLHHSSPTRGGTPKVLGAGGLHPPYGSRDLHHCTNARRAFRTRHFAPRFEGGSGFPRARGAFRKFGQHKGIGITRWAFRELDYTVARVVPERHGASEVLFTMFDRGFFIGISEGNTGRCPGLCCFGLSGRMVGRAG